MRHYLRRASSVIGVLLIVLAFRSVKSACHTVLPTSRSSGTTATTPTATDTPPDSSIRFDIEEEACTFDLRMPAAWAMAGVAAIAGGVMLRPKR